jgi:NTP pyrophosphatase (non-canonical NTP hydrolase)
MNYIEESARTKSPLRCPIDVDIEHGIIGIASEAGELLDALKKHIYYGKQIDSVNVKEELGDLFFYAALLCRHFGWTFEEIQQQNIAKLKARYPDKFTQDKALNRDLTKERKVLESSDEDDTGEDRQFLVHWEMDIAARTTKEAAEKALAVHRNTESIATVFDVFEGGHFQARVDLTEDTVTQ